jgi:hypothetical protein
VSDDLDAGVASLLLSVTAGKIPTRRFVGACCTR